MACLRLTSRANSVAAQQLLHFGTGKIAGAQKSEALHGAVKETAGPAINGINKIGNEE
jgi:hypothetical protein